MNFKSILAAVVIALTPVAAGAVTINITANGDELSTVGTIIADVGGIGFNIAGSATDGFIRGKLESTVVVTAVNTLGSGTVELIADYVNFGDFDLMDIWSQADVKDITGVETPIDPVRGTLDVEHFISFDGGITKTALALFPFGGSTGEMVDFDTIANDGPYQLSSLFTFTADRAGAVSVTGEILAAAENVPAPASILLMGPALVGLGVMRRKAKKAA